MKKASTENTKADVVYQGTFSETITAVQRALVDASPFDILLSDEIVAIKTSLKELEVGNVRFIPYIGRKQFENVWASYRGWTAAKETAVAEDLSFDLEDLFGEEKLGESPETEEKYFKRAPPPAGLPAKGKVLEEESAPESRLEAEAEPEKPQVASWYIAMPETFTKSIKGLDKKIQGRILEALGKIVRDPLKEVGDTVKPLSRDMKGLWRYRIGGYRLIYRPEVDTNRIVLVACGARGSVYE